MSRLENRGLGVALMLLLGPTAALAGQPPRASGNWFQRLFGLPAKAPAAKPAPPAPARYGQDVAEKPVPASRPVSQVDEVAVERDRELQALLRRQAVCLKLMRIAVETNDDDLMHKAEQLDERARQVYAERTAHLPGSYASFESDEQVLQRHLGPRSAATGRLLDTASGSAASGQARAQEDKR